jgi:hypothetical protein
LLLFFVGCKRDISAKSERQHAENKRTRDASEKGKNDFICTVMLTLTHFVLLQQQRGCEVSTEAWKVALEHAERLVVLAEKKLQRQREAYARRISKLEVRVFLFCQTFRHSHFSMYG